MKRRSVVAKSALASIAMLGGLCGLGCSSGDQGFTAALESGAPLEMCISACYPAYDASELAARSNLVVSGEVLGYSEPFMINPVDGADPRCFTEVYVALEDIFKGDPLESKMSTAVTGSPGTKDARTVIAIRFLGGATDAFTVTSDERPNLEVGEKGLLFLYRVADGSDYNTEGNHYYLVTGALSAWEKVGDKYRSPEGSELTAEQVQSAAIGSVSANEEGDEGDVDINLTNNGVRSSDDILKTLEKQKAAGAISEEEYETERARAVQAQHGFAKIMSSDEVEAYEEEVMELYLLEK